METLVIDTRRQVAEEVRAYLARKRMSVREAARKLGLGQTAMHRRVIGEIPFDVGEIAAIAELLDVPVESFFAGPSESGAGASVRKRWFLHRRSDLRFSAADQRAA